MEAFTGSRPAALVDGSDGKEGIEPREIVHDRRGRQRGDETPAVALRPQPRVEHREDAAVRPMANEAAESLLKREDRQRHLILAERVAAPRADGVAARRGNRIAGR